MSRIGTLADLKAALSSPGFAEAIRDFDPAGLVSSIRWKTYLSSHFQLHCHDDSQEDHDFGASLAAHFERIYGELETFLSLAPRSKQERLIVQARLTCFVARTASTRTFGTVPGPGLLFYLLDPDQDPDFMLRFRHEIAHLMWGRLYGEAPALFNEGLAVFAADMSIPGATPDALLGLDAAAVAGMPQLAEVAFNESFWSFRERGSPLYRVGGALIQYLVQHHGWEKLRDLFLMSDYEDPSILDHFATIYGEGLSTVDADLREYLASREG